ncbi:MAG: DUF1697 domain-containing protein [Acidimicrobiia bacterium]
METQRYAVFLRAINVGGRRVKMDDLRSVFVGAGFPDAQTYIASGNVVVSAKMPPDRVRIETAIESELGFASEAFVRSEDQTRSILERVPWDTSDNLVEVSFLQDAPADVDARRLEAMVVQPEQLVVSGAEVFFLREGKGVDTRHKESVTSATLHRVTTRRGIATVEKIAARFFGP